MPKKLAVLSRVANLHVISEHAARMEIAAEAFLVMLYEMAHMSRSGQTLSLHRPVVPKTQCNRHLASEDYQTRCKMVLASLDCR